MKYQNIREGEIENKVAHDYFKIYDCTRKIGDVDFCICMQQSQKEISEQESLLWAEAKTGSSDIYKSIVQLILTIGKAKTFDKFLPPSMLGAFDGEKIGFIPYNDIHEVFYINDFNWKVTPSNHSTKEFKLIHEKVKTIIDTKTLLFDFLKDDRDLKKFIENNFIVGKFELTKTRIDKNNFMVIYNKWLQNVKPTIAVKWEVAKKSGIIDGDFYLADLLSHENNTLKENLFVLLKHDHYELDRKISESGLFIHSETSFTDKQKAHIQFWNKYDRPPKEEYWDYIVERRDRLVPQDVRERKGSFFTPQMWVELSQKYLTDVLGEDWQDEYYVWDCAAGTGNLLAGLTNKYNIWASTLDNQDVDVIHDRIKNGANLLDDHVFQFDFLNDDFNKLPKPLQDIINNPEKRKKLVIYINPPYAEAGNKDVVLGKGDHKTDVAVKTKVYEKYREKLGIAGRELFAQFYIRVFYELQLSKLAVFSKLKIIQAPNFDIFRTFFKSKIETSFVVPANTFDNVKGLFPIGFFLWNTEVLDYVSEIKSDVYNIEGKREGTKIFYSNTNLPTLTDWITSTRKRLNEKKIGFISCRGNDFQQNNVVYIMNDKDQMSQPRGSWITDKNLLEVSIYLAVRHSIEMSWLNDRDQFLYPNDEWKKDDEFKNDCLAFTLFSSQNRITNKEGNNHWIPFTEQEVNSREKFESNFMTRYLKGKIKRDEGQQDIFSVLKEPTPHYEIHLRFSEEAQSVFDSGRELWKYYHAQSNCNVNASFYDIREHFQGRNDIGKMNNKSYDETYMKLIGDLREKLRSLAGKIEPKVYEYGFLKE